MLILLSVYRWGFQARAAGASAELRGGPLAPQITGTMTLEAVPGGTRVTVRVQGLPGHRPGPPPTGPLGFHIHEKRTCEVGDPNDPFTAAGGHFNPDGEPHGNHAGDFPVLFSNDGTAEASFFTNRFRPQDVVGRSVIVHQHPDDYRTQPAGDSGPRLACGVIR
ncbi:superoxide dismutase family protein [Limnochorda pilosa]|uniref:superoxide dismutase family protein n=1 Tax=Limnochorda pilosa TaxID=1555112 RepID=UPI00082987AA